MPNKSDSKGASKPDKASGEDQSKKVEKNAKAAEDQSGGKNKSSKNKK